MRHETSNLRRGLQACVLAAGLTAVTAHAAVTQLGFILDRSGSIGSGNWTTIVNGLASAVNSFVPANGSCEVSVVAFDSSATIAINSFLVTDTTTRSTLAGLISGIPYTAGGTDFGPAFSAMQTALTDNVGVNYGANPVTTAATATASYVNLSTDGQAPDASVQRNALVAAGVDNISIEGIGTGVDATSLKNLYCYPGPCDDTAPYNFPTQGFYIAVANAAAYAAAIGPKIQLITVPEPASIALVGVALLGLAAARRNGGARSAPVGFRMA